VNLSPAALEACHQLAGGAPVLLSPLRSVQSRPDQCHINVSRKVARSGGGFVFGWHVFEVDTATTLFVFHSCWRNPAGTIMDVTPLEPEYRRLGLAAWSSRLFLPDPARRLEFQQQAGDRWVYLGWKNRTFSDGGWVLMPSAADVDLDPQGDLGERSLWIWSKQLAGLTA
jgi:hypothetical protein